MSSTQTRKLTIVGPATIYFEGADLPYSLLSNQTMTLDLPADVVDAMFGSESRDCDTSATSGTQS